MQRSIAWIGMALIATSLSSCALLRQQLGLEQEAPVTLPPVVNDEPRKAPLQPGENVIVKAVDWSTLGTFPHAAIDRGMLFEDWLEHSMPHVINCTTHVLIITSIVPYEPRKRSRE